MSPPYLPVSVHKLTASIPFPISPSKPEVISAAGKFNMLFFFFLFNNTGAKQVINQFLFSHWNSCNKTAPLKKREREVEHPTWYCAQRALSKQYCLCISTGVLPLTFQVRLH